MKDIRVFMLWLFIILKIYLNVLNAGHYVMLIIDNKDKMNKSQMIWNQKEID